MQAVSKSKDIKIEKMSDVIVDPSKVNSTSQGPVIIVPIVFSCGLQFSLSLKDVKAAPVPASIAILPHQDSKYNPTVLQETPATFKAIDSSVKTKVTEWNITIPDKAVAYATFSKVVFLDLERDAILFVTSTKNDVRLYLKNPQGTHVWYSDAKAVYCKKHKLFVFDSEGYSMYIDLGLQ